MISSKENLRPYQCDTLSQIIEAWENSRSVMAQMPTGTGKTHVLASVVSGAASRTIGKTTVCGCAVLILAHRRDLVSQISDTLSAFGIEHDVFGRCADAGENICSSPVIVSSVQTMAKRIGSIGFEPNLVIVDEAHHALAKTYRALWDRWPSSRFLGLTATPCRLNGMGFTDLFDALVTSWSIPEFISRGYLSAFDYVSIRPDSEEQVLISSLTKRGADGDYQVKEMDAALNRMPSIERLYRSARQYADGKKGIVYAISISHARSIAEYYCAQGIHAVAIDSKTPASDRKRMVEEFRCGRIQVLANVDVFSEGFDCPDVEFVQMARPTLSLSKYLQQVGRGLRKSEGKEACVLIDNVGLYRSFGLPTEEWDWEAMFRGRMAGKGRSAQQMKDRCISSHAEDKNENGMDGSMGDDMEVIVSHDRLFEYIKEQKNIKPNQAAFELKSWHDSDTGLWGLRIGHSKITDAKYLRIFDIRYNMAAVQLSDGVCGIADADGNEVWESDRCASLKFIKNRMASITTSKGRERFLDLHSLKMYDSRPKTVKTGDVELLLANGRYYSRTRDVYASTLPIEYISVKWHGFYLTVFDTGAPPCCGLQTSCDGKCYGHVCLLPDDHDCYYWIYKKLADGSIVIRRADGRYYRMEDGKEKVCIGCDTSSSEEKELQKTLKEYEAQAQERKLAEEEKARRSLMDNYGEAIPFKSGMRWGLKVGERIVIPPVYRKVSPPVGMYCAVEKNYCQWGVFAVDGTMVVEPKYSDVSLSDDGSAVLTFMTGRKLAMRLPEMT